MIAESSLALLGFGLIAIFLAAVMGARVSAVVALVLLPIAFALLGGFGARIGPMIVDGLRELAPTAAMLIFAILYFGLMIDAGLFDPVVRRVVQAVRGDPLRVALGTAILALIVSLDGDGATTIMVTVTALLPIYRRLGMRPVILAVLIILANMVINIAPWGGPTARAAAALKLDPADIFVPLVPAILLGACGVLGIAYVLGRAEQRRLAREPVVTEHSTELQSTELAATAGPDQVVSPAANRYFWFNVALTGLVMASVIAQLLPLAVILDRKAHV